MRDIAMTVEVTVNGHQFRVSGTFTPAIPGRYSGPPERCYPDEAAEFAVRTVHLLHEDGSEPTYLPPDFLECFYVGCKIATTTYRGVGDDLYTAISYAAAEKAEDSYDEEGDRADEEYERRIDRELNAAMEKETK